MSVRKEIISNSAWVFLARLLGALTSVGLYAVLTRLLPADQVGLYFLALTTVTIFATVTGLGLPKTATRMLAKAANSTATPQTPKTLVSLSISLTISASLLSAILILSSQGNHVIREWLDAPQLAGLGALMVAWVVFFALRQLLAECFRGLGDIRFASLFGGLIASTLALLMLGYCNMSLGLELTLGDVIAIVVCSTAISCILAMLLLYRGLARLGENHNLGRLRVWGSVTTLLLTSWPLLMTDTLQILSTQSHVWVLGALSDKSELAIYGTVVQISLLVSMPFIIINNTLPHMIVRMFDSGDKQQLENILRTVATLATCVALIAIAVIYLVGKPVLGWIYGDYYTAGWLPLLILAIGQLLNVASGSAGVALVYTGHQHTYMLITVPFGILSILLSIALVPYHGAIGACISVALVMALQNILSVYYAWRHTGLLTCLSLRVDLSGLPWRFR